MNLLNRHSQGDHRAKRLVGAGISPPGRTEAVPGRRPRSRPGGSPAKHHAALCRTRPDLRAERVCIEVRICRRRRASSRAVRRDQVPQGTLARTCPIVGWPPPARPPDGGSVMASYGTTGLTPAPVSRPAAGGAQSRPPAPPAWLRTPPPQRQSCWATKQLAGWPSVTSPPGSSTPPAGSCAPRGGRFEGDLMDRELTSRSARCG